VSDPAADADRAPGAGAATEASSEGADPFHLPTLTGGEVKARLEAGRGPLLVDFFATWCGPCAWIIPTLRALRESHGDRVEIVKVDVDEATEMAAALRIASVPTVILFEDGAEVERSLGVEPERVRQMVEEAHARAKRGAG
jgi:thioredoxin 1